MGASKHLNLVPRFDQKFLTRCGAAGVGISDRRHLARLLMVVGAEEASRQKVGGMAMTLHHLAADDGKAISARRTPQPRVTARHIVDELRRQPAQFLELE